MLIACPELSNGTGLRTKSETDCYSSHVVKLILVRLSRTLIGSLALVAAAFGAGLRPAQPEIPLLRVFEPLPMKTNPTLQRPLVTFDPAHPLLVVWSSRDLMLARDKRSVLITLT